jgi:hypothetical protein
VHNAAAPFTSHKQAASNYAEPKTSIFGLSSSNITVQYHVPIATGDALRH